MPTSNKKLLFPESDSMAIFKTADQSERAKLLQIKNENAKWGSIIGAFDTNGDGKVSLKDFTKAIQKFILEYCGE